MQKSILSRAANNLENTTPDNSLDIKNTGGIYLSVIVPAYNEGERLPKTLRRFDEYFSKEPYSYEILIVADGPKDNIIEVAKNMEPPLRRLTPHLFYEIGYLESGRRSVSRHRQKAQFSHSHAEDFR